MNAPPRFMDRLQNQTVREGEPVSFHCEAAGVPTPMMGWQRDGKMLNDSPMHRIQTDGGKTSLFIDKTTPEDSAWFQCIAANIAGTATNRAKLIVQGILLAQLSNWLEFIIFALGFLQLSLADQNLREDWAFLGRQSPLRKWSLVFICSRRF